MEITKIYKEGTTFEDLSQDKVIIEMNEEDYIKLESILFRARMEWPELAKQLNDKLKIADECRKVKWV